MKFQLAAKYQTALKVFRMCRPHVPSFGLLALIILLIPASEIVMSYSISMLADRYHRTESIAWAYAWWISGAMALYIFLGWARTKENFKRIGYGIGFIVESRAYRKLQELPMKDLYGDMREKREVIEKGTRSVMDMLERIFRGLLPVFFILSLTFVFLARADLRIGLCFVLWLLLYVRSSVKLNREIIPAVEAYEAYSNKRSERYWEKVQNARLTVMSGQQRHEQEDHQDWFRAFARQGNEIYGGYITNGLLRRDPYCLACLASLLFLCLWLMSEKSIGPGTFIFVMWWATASFKTMTDIGPMQREFVADWARVKAYIAFLEASTTENRPKGHIRPQSFESGIVFDRVHFNHSVDSPTRPYTLEDVSFEIERGSFTSIVGPSGSGKSTLLKLLLGVYAPGSGSVSVCGSDMRSIDLSWWWRQIGYVEQNPSFWNRTMMDNVRYGIHGDPDAADDEEIAEALRKARLEEFVVSGRAKFEPIGENGSKLSGGEKQRLAIARALVGRPQVIIFDEAASGLDNESAARMLDTLLALTEERDGSGRKKYTIIAVAHNMITASKADKVILMEQGKVSDIGTHLQLCERSRLYERLVLNDMLTQKIGESNTPPIWPDETAA